MKKSLFGDEEMFDFGSLTEDQRSKRLLADYIAKRTKEAQELDRQIETKKEENFLLDQENARLTTETDNLRDQRDKLSTENQDLKDENEAYQLIIDQQQEQYTQANLLANDRWNKARRDSEVAEKEKHLTEKAAERQRFLTYGHEVVRQMITKLLDLAKFRLQEATSKETKATQVLIEAEGLSGRAKRILEVIEGSKRVLNVRQAAQDDREKKLKMREDQVKTREENIVLEKGQLNQQARRQKLDEYR